MITVGHNSRSPLGIQVHIIRRLRFKIIILWRFNMRTITLRKRILEKETIQ